MDNIQHIAIIGSGRAAQYFGALFTQNGIEVTQVISRNIHTGEALARSVHSSFSSELKVGNEVQLVLLCVNDDEIKDVAAKLQVHDQVVCHCAGAVELDVLEGFNRRGVLYPLQSLGGDLKNAEVPFLVEASDDDVLLQLESLLEACGKVSRNADSGKRKLYHLAAVYANNFSNAMLMATEDLTSHFHLDFDLLRPLVEQTFRRLEKHRPSEVQTGPAQRNDGQTMARHLAILSDHPELRELYTEVSAYIMSRLGKIS